VNLEPVDRVGAIITSMKWAAQGLSFAARIV
jgi:hypothetical protein